VVEPLCLSVRQLARSRSSPSLQYNNRFWWRLSTSQLNVVAIYSALISSTVVCDARAHSNDRMQRQRPELVASFADVNRMAILQLLSPRHTNISPEATMEMLTYIASRCVVRYSWEFRNYWTVTEAFDSKWYEENLSDIQLQSIRSPKRLHKYV